MTIRLTPDRDTSVQKQRIGGVPTLILKSRTAKPCRVGLLWIHGGGYILGMKEMVYMSRAADLMHLFGVTVFSPGYRLAWLRPYPAAANDCFAVLRYMDAHRAELGFDRIMVGGESAGGGLCAAVCMMARDAGIHISFQMPLYPMIDNFDTESSTDNHGKVWNTRRNHLAWRVYLRSRAKSQVPPYAAPARQEDYANLPPCYTFVGEGEPFYAETLAYAANLRSAGVEAEADVYPTDVHAFDMLRSDTALARRARLKLQEHFEYALGHYQ